MDLFGRLAGVDAVDEGIIKRGEDIVAFLEGLALFEFIGGTIANADTVKGGVEIEFEEKNVIGGGGEFFVDCADFFGVEAAHSLIGHGGEIITVENNGLAAGQGGLNQGLDVFAAVAVEEVEFLLGREAAGRGGLAKPGAERTIGRFL